MKMKGRIFVKKIFAKYKWLLIALLMISIHRGNGQRPQWDMLPHAKGQHLGLVLIAAALHLLKCFQQRSGKASAGGQTRMNTARRSHHPPPEYPGCRLRAAPLRIPEIFPAAP